jgi:hypothetical protein
MSCLARDNRITTSGSLGVHYFCTIPNLLLTRRIYHLLKKSFMQLAICITEETAYIHFICILLVLILSSDNTGSRDSSVSIVSGYGLDDRGSIPGGGKEDFSSSFCVQTGSRAHPASWPMGTGGLFLGGKAWQGRDAGHSPPSSAEVENE